MRKYRRVTYEDRCHITAYLQVELSLCEISRRLGFHKSTILREIRRNSGRLSYCPEQATKKAFERFKRCRRPKLMTSEAREKIRPYLSFGWSPEQISGRFKLEGSPLASRQTIYRGLPQKSPEKRLLRTFGRKGSGRRHQKKIRENRYLMVSERPSLVDQRKRIGDWERDGVYGANRKQLLVLIERKSRYTKLAKMFDITGEAVTNLTISTLKGLRVHTMTNDNGPEFSDSASLPFLTYHCEPHKPQQRGAVENAIGLLRQYIKRKTNLEALSEKDLSDLENRLNFRPRKCLDYKTPYEVFYNTIVALVT